MDTYLFLVPLAENAAFQSAIKLKNGKHTIGRSPDCQIYLADQTVSREHATLNVSDQKVVLTDLNSRNGTWVDNQRVERASLQRGQEIRFGNMVFVLSSDPNRSNYNDTDPGIVIPLAARKSENPSGLLKPRQFEVMTWLLQGLNEKEVAVKLGISRETVHNHVRAIYAAYKVHSRVELLLKVNPIKGIKPENPHTRK